MHPLTPETIPPALFRLETQESKDFDHQASLIHGWQQEYKQITPGKFLGKLSQLYLPDVHFFIEHTGQALFQHGMVNECIAIGLPLQQEAAPVIDSLFCGQHYQGNALLLYSGQEGFEFISRQNMVVGVISVTLAFLENRVPAEQYQQILQRSRKSGLLPVPPEIRLAIRQLLESVFSLLVQQPPQLHMPGFIDTLRQHALALITEALLQEAGLNSKCRDSWGTVAAVRACMEQAGMEALSVASICQQLGISRRTLQYHFEEALNMSPLHFMRTERLNLARKMLKMTHSVTEAATHSGFWHFGHFAQHYRRMFGELPSSTLRRHHGLAELP